MDILMLLDTYVPARTSGAVQMRDLAVELTRQGHRVAVAAPTPKLATPWSLERHDGVEVLRVRAPRTKDIGYARRTVAEGVLPYYLYRAFIRSPLSEASWDAVIWYSPSIFLGPAVRRIKKRYGIKGYLILRDLFPDWAVDAGVMRRGPAYRLLKRVERFQYSLADVIGVQSVGNVPLVRKTITRGNPRTEVLENWLSDAPCVECSIDLGKTALAGKKIFVYAGNMGVAQGMDSLLELALSLRERSDAAFLFVGRGSEVPRLRDWVEAQDLRHVLFMEEVEPGQIPGLLAQCHFGLIALDTRHTTHNIPGKFLTYLRAGLPVLARVNPNNNLARLIDEAGVGYVCGDESGDRLLHLAEKLLDKPELAAEMGRCSRELAEARYTATGAAGQILRALE